MNFKPKITLSLLLLGVLLLALLRREPSYQGRTLSNWLMALDYSIPGFQAKAVPEAEQAIKAIGQRSLPLLLSMTHAQDSPLKIRLLALIGKKPIPAEKLRWRGARGVQVLAPDAITAVPRLSELLLNDPSSWVRSRAALVLGKFGSNATPVLPALNSALNDPVVDVRNCVCLALGELRTAARPALPVLQQRLNDAEPHTQVLAFGALLSITNDPSLVRTNLTRLLNDPRPDTRGGTVPTIGSLGPAARWAMADLKPLLQDHDSSVRHAATNALRHLEATADTKAEALSFRFENIAVEDILRFYSDIVGNRVEIAPDVQRTRRITVKAYGGTTRPEALEMIEAELRAQGSVVLTRLSNGVVVAKPASTR